MQTSGATCREIVASHSSVIPAQAGIQYSRDANDRWAAAYWIPACAGMTMVFCVATSTLLHNDAASDLRRRGPQVP